MKIENVLLVDPLIGEFTGTIEIAAGKIVSVERKEKSEYHEIVMPGFVDTHTHGCMGVDTMRMDQKDLEKWEEFLNSQGVTSFLPTTVSAKKEDMLRVAKMIKGYMSNHENSSVRGVHYEGPYINISKKGAQNPSAIRSATVEELKDVILDNVLLIAMAPEIEGFQEALKALQEMNVVVSICHTDSSYEEMKKAFEMGCNRITHFPNALKGLHHREIGGVGAGLLHDFNLEMIVDGVHSVPEFVELIYKLKGAEKLMLITDSIDATCLEDGIYDLGGLRVTVKDEHANLDDGTIAGSTLTFNRAVKNFKAFTGCSLKELARVSSYNALNNLGLTNCGRLEAGFDADLVVLDKNLTVKKTIIGGKTVFGE